MNTPFGTCLSSLTEFEELRQQSGGSPSKVAAGKVIHHLDRHCRSFIAQSPFLTMATADANGLCDVSPRGDAPGFVHILDDKHLLIPERPGNRRMDSVQNILSNPHVGLIFFIPGLQETLRINGKACVTRDQQLLGELSVQGKVPLFGIGVEVEEIFIHCAKAFLRSGLWAPETWPAKEDLPSAAKILADHVKLPALSEEDIASQLAESYQTRLY